MRIFGAHNQVATQHALHGQLNVHFDMPYGNPVRQMKLMAKGSIIYGRNKKHGIYIRILYGEFDIQCPKTVAIDTPGGKRNLKMKIKAQQMTFKQDITKI